MNAFMKFLKKISANSAFFENVVLGLYLVYAMLNKLLFVLARIVPVIKKKIVFCNMKGVRYGDNPMYISEALHEKRPEYEIVWLIDEKNMEEIPHYARRVKYGYFNNLIELVTSSVWVDSNTKHLGTAKRKNQLFIQTWHGSYGIKKIALDLKEDLAKVDRLLYPYNSKIADVMVSNSKRTSEIFRRAFAFENKILEVGSPRNDIFSNSDTPGIVERVKSEFEIGDSHFVLYAPTWRKGYNMDFFNIDFEQVREALAKKYGGTWYVLIRLHPLNLKDAKNIKYGKYIINASEYSVMQDLLVAADVLITDYSSCMFDYITKPKPCFIYAPDLEKYENDRGNYFKMSELPFPLAKDNGELVANIENFETEAYTQKVKELHDTVGLCETGRASELVADYIIDFIENGKK